MDMTSWIKQNFAEYPDANVVVATIEDTTVTTSPDWLSTQLGTTIPPTYAFLKTTALYTTGGWGWVIDSWKAKDIIK